MGNEFTIDEIREAIRTARLYSPSVTAEQLEEAIELQKHLSDSDYLEAVRSLTRLEREEGVLCTEALDRCKQLVHDMAQKEAELASLQEKLIVQQDKNRQAEDEYRQMKEAIEQAKEGLSQVEAERGREEKGLSAFRKKADKQERRIDKEVDEYRRKANVTKEEAVIAGQIKAQVESYGFSLELALKLSQEFAGCENAREALAKAIEEHGTLTQSNAALIEQTKRLKSGLSYVQSEVDKGEANCAQLERTSSELRAEIAGNGEIIDFYHRYLHLRSLIEYLGSWYVTFHHCNWCGCLFWILNPGKVDISARKCPWCGFLLVESDRNAYAAIGQPLDTAVKLLL